MIVSLTGFMGSGKSSIGRVLAGRLGCPFFDLDSLIEEGEGRSIPDIFSSGGERLFRNLEIMYLSDFLDRTPRHCPSGPADKQAPPVTAVLALGGGTLTTAECAGMVEEKTFCIYLRASADTLVENLKGAEEGRPMLSGENLRERVEDLMAKRKDIYEGAARAVIDTDGKTYGESSDEILEILTNPHN